MARHSISAAVCIAALIGLASGGRAQLAASLDVGAATVRYDGYLRSGVVSVTPAARLDRPQYRVVARGTGSFFESGNHSVDLLAGGSLFTRATGAWRGEAGGTGSITLYEGSRTANAEASLRAHRLGAGGGMWLGTGAGIVTGSTEKNGAWTLDAGAWIQRRSLTAAAGVAHTLFRGARYVDVEGTMRWIGRTVELGARGGARSGDDVGGSRGWGDVDVLLWLSRNVALTGSWGAYALDPTRGAPGGHYAVASLRIATRPLRLRDLFDRSGRYAPPPAARPVVASFAVETVASDRRRLVVRATGAQAVELAGDFTNWNPLPFERARDGSWVLEVEIPAGSHFFNLRVDGGAWGVPPNVPVVRDDFGGFVGLLLIG